MPDRQPSPRPARYQLSNIVAGLVLIGLFAFLSYKIYTDSPSEHQVADFPWFDNKNFAFIIGGCGIVVGFLVMFSSVPRVFIRQIFGSFLPEEERKEHIPLDESDKRKLSWWIAGPLLLLIFAVFVGLLWAGMYE
jgi:hypothetical protein